MFCRAIALRCSIGHIHNTYSRCAVGAQLGYCGAWKLCCPQGHMHVPAGMACNDVLLANTACVVGVCCSMSLDGSPFWCGAQPLKEQCWLHPLHGAVCSLTDHSVQHQATLDFMQGDGHQYLHRICSFCVYSMTLCIGMRARWYTSSATVSPRVPTWQGRLPWVVQRHLVMCPAPFALTASLI
jgi:hypothetical protein